MKTILSLLLVISLSNLTIAQTTAIPDPNFEQALINLGLDVVLDGAVLTANIDTVTYLDVSFKNINDLTGIEDFILLKQLFCIINQLTNLNISQNIALTSLICSSNQLTNLDVTQNTLLTDLKCENNQLTSINITQNNALTILLCGNNLLTSLDVTQNAALTSLSCTNNQLTSLDISQNTNLTSLSCAVNQITSLDVTQNAALTNLSCTNDQLTSLNVSQNTNLTSLSCDGNQLVCLNLKNGNNTNITWFDATNNPNLSCIEVDNAAWSTTNWFFIDASASFSTNCPNPCLVGINENNITNLSFYPNPTTGNITIDLGEVKQNLKATLTNGLGQIILAKQFESADIINLNIDAPTGIYFLQLETASGETKTIKILKE